MGSSSSKGHKDIQKYGQIHVQTDRPAYYAGETITGRIYINLVMPFPGKRLSLKLKGKELFHFVRRERVLDDYHDIHYHAKNDIIKKIAPVYTWDALMPGQFTIPFAFVLPHDLPSSFHQRGNRYLADVSYRLEAILEPDMNTNPAMKSKQPLIVRTPIKTVNTGCEKEITTNIQNCKYCEKGTTNLKVKFGKNFYYPGETAQVSVSFDNTQSQMNIQKISFSLKQKITFRKGNGYMSYSKVFVKAKNSLYGVRKGEKIQNQPLEIKLKPFQLQQESYKEKEVNNIKSYLLDLSEDEDFMHSETKSSLITSEYVLDVSCQMDGCFSTVPQIQIPIYIQYPDIPLTQVVAPNNWKPTEMQPIILSFGAGDTQLTKAINLGPNTMGGVPSYDKNILQQQANIKYAEDASTNNIFGPTYPPLPQSDFQPVNHKGSPNRI